MQIRKLQPSDRSEFLAFLAQIELRVSVESRFSWLYEDNPHGRATTWLAVDPATGRILGCNSVFPRKLWVDQRIVLGSFGGDTFVHPKARGRGVATALHRACAQDMGAGGIVCEYGFPNPPNLRAFAKAGAHLSEDFRALHLVLAARALVSRLPVPQPLGNIAELLLNPLVAGYLRLRLPPAEHGYSITQVHHFDERFDALQEEILPTFRICGVRDSAWLNWRYFENPAQKHVVLACESPERLEGFAVLQPAGDRSYLFDFFVRPGPGPADALISGLTSLARERGAALVSAILNTRGNYSDCFLRRGYRFRKKVALELLLPHSPNRAERLTRLHDWYLMYGDCDLESLGQPDDFEV